MIDDAKPYSMCPYVDKGHISQLRTSFQVSTSRMLLIRQPPEPLHVVTSIVVLDAICGSAEDES